MNYYKYLFFGLFISSNIFVTAQAQVAVDGTTNTKLTPTDNGITIDDGDRIGDNLFHSFQDFSISEGSSATFNNALDVENIFSRVTGGNISDINGAINANGGANLLLINPAGIVFGGNARLNIGGSFLATTADSLLFEGSEFSAVNPQAAPILTIDRPIGLNFGNNPGNIINRANFGLQTTSVDIGLIPEFTVRDSVGLEVNNGETISLIGGNIIMENAAGISSPGGVVELGGLSEAGTVMLDPSPIFPEGIERSNVTLTEQSRVNVSANGGGVININAKNLELSQRSELLAGIAEDSNFETNAGDINIDATALVKIVGELNISTAETFEKQSKHKPLPEIMVREFVILLVYHRLEEIQMAAKPWGMGGMST
ncbi:MAG: filamentous hemagglutinin N-terminal domain-containing protein [Pleurocapsa sp.]